MGKESDREPQKDWHADLISAAEARLFLANRNHQRDEKAWRTAVAHLRESRATIRTLKSGPRKGEIIGLPKKLSVGVVQVFIRIVNGDEPVIPELLDGVTNLTIRPEESKNFRNIQYRDCKYALLAALYRNYEGPMVNMIGTAHLKSSAQKHTDENFEEQYIRTGRLGAWKVKDTLKQEGYVAEVKEGAIGPKSYSLSREGAKLCHALFSKRFCPPQYPDIKPKAGICDADGNFHDTDSLSRRPFPGNVNSIGRNLAEEIGYASRRESFSFDDSDELLTDRRFQSVSSNSSQQTFSATKRPASEDMDHSWVKRKRMMKFDPDSTSQMQTLMQETSVTEAEAWRLIDHGATDYNSKAKKMNAPSPHSASTECTQDDAILYLLKSGICETINDAMALLAQHDFFEQIKVAVSKNKMDAAESNIIKQNSSSNVILPTPKLPLYAEPICEVKSASSISGKSKNCKPVFEILNESPENLEISTESKESDSDLQILVSYTPKSKDKKQGLTYFLNFR